MKYIRQLRSLLIHKWFVVIAGRRLGLPLWRLLAHDLSKFFPVEFVNRSRWEYGVKDKVEWARGWLHHLHVNKHHPEHWIVPWCGDPDFYSEVGEHVAKNISVLPMPAVHVREMVADWMAKSKEHTGSYDIAAWLAQEVPKVRLHNTTKGCLARTLSEIGYSLYDICPPAWKTRKDNR